MMYVVRFSAMFSVTLWVGQARNQGGTGKNVLRIVENEKKCVEDS